MPAQHVGEWSCSQACSRRLRRISELTGLDLEDPDQRLAVLLTLRGGGQAPDGAA
nr:hypothetical protein GCM10020063_103980 [Dactylosporangium thailandense]